MANRGVWLALTAAVLFGVSAPLAKLLLGGTSPQLLAGLLYLGSGVGLGVIWLVRRARGTSREAPLSRRDLPWLGGAIVAGGVTGPLLLMIGLTRTPASSASLLLNLEGVLTAAIAWVVFRENVDRRVASVSRCSCSRSGCWAPPAPAPTSPSRPSSGLPSRSSFFGSARPRRWRSRVR